MFDKFILLCLILVVSTTVVCLFNANNKINNLEKNLNQLEHDVDYYISNWQPIEHGVALTPKEIRRLRDLCRCK